MSYTFYLPLYVLLSMHPRSKYTLFFYTADRKLEDSVI